MFKEYKNNAKKLLMDNFKVFILPLLAMFFVESVGYVLLNFGVDYKMIVFGSTSDFLPIVLYLILGTMCLAYATGWVWKQCVSVVFNKTINLKEYKITGVILVNVVFSFLWCLYSILDSLNTYIFEVLYGYSFWVVILLGLLLLRCYLFYKLMASNYIYYREKEKPIQALKTSFSLIRQRAFYFFKLDFSFILWEILILAIHLVLHLLLKNLNVDTWFLGVLSIMGYGINFYLVPYKFLTYVLIIDSEICSK